MSDRPTIARLGKLVAADVTAGRPGPNSRAASQFLEARPEAILELLHLLNAEVQKKRPREKLVTAYVFMVGQALEFTRYAIEAGRAEAAKLVDRARKQLAAMGKAGQMEPALLLMVLREFANAKLDPGTELQAVMEQLMGASSTSAPEPDGLESIDGHLAEIAGAVDGNAFEFFTHAQEMADAFPMDRRAAMAACLLHSREGTAREAALGWLLDGSSSVRNTTASVIEQAATTGDVSGVTLRRLITVRNWLPDTDRMSLDRAIQACRRKNIEISPWPRCQVREVLASGIDGAGAQSIFVFAREGRRNTLACMLLKCGIGIRDAWARQNLTSSELREFVGQLKEIELRPCTLEYIRIAVAHSLAVNLQSGVMPPFALLDVLETAGLQGIQPKALTAEDVLNLMETEADSRISQPEIVADILARSRDLPGDFAFLDSWFEADDEVEHLLGAKRLSRVKKIALVQEELLTHRREKWAERLAWTALLLHHGDENEPWDAFFVSAAQLAAGRVHREIPLLTHVAELTVDANVASHPDRRSGPKPS